MPNPSTQAPIDPNRLQTLRQELYEVENRYAELGERGLFHLLEQAHVLDHQLPDLGDVEHAMRHPPPVGRARLRGQFVQRCAQRHGTFWCDWSGLWDGQNKRMADLTDPFCAEPNWVDWRPEEPGLIGVAEIHARRELMRARGYVETGGHAQALDALSNIQPFWRTLSPRVADEFLSLFAETQSRCGQMGGLDALRHLQARRPTNLDVITTALNTHLHLGLTPHPDTSNWVLRGDHLLARATAHVPSQRAAFLYSKGCFLNRTGRAREALPVLSEATRLAEMDPSRQPFLGRALAELAEAHRLTQNLREARRLLVQARHLQRRLGCDGDLAGWTLLYRAKLESRSEHAAPWLERADRLLRQCRDSVGEVRCCLLKARFTREPALLASLQGRISVLREPRPALLNCPKLTHLLRHWHEWSGGNFGPDEHGDFFWGI